MEQKNTENSTWYNWQPTGHIRSETICHQAREIMLICHHLLQARLFSLCRRFKNIMILYCMLIYAQVQYTVLTSKPYPNVQVFQAKIVSESSCCSSRLKTRCDNNNLCGSFNYVYISNSFVHIAYYGNFSFLNKLLLKTKRGD